MGERFPIGYRFVDDDGDVRVVVDYWTDGRYETVYRSADGEWHSIITEHFTIASSDPYVDPVTLMDGTEYGLVESDGSFYGFVTQPGLDGEESTLTSIREQWPDCRPFRYGIRDGELFIEWVEGLGDVDG